MVKIIFPNIKSFTKAQFITAVIIIIGVYIFGALTLNNFEKESSLDYWMKVTNVFVPDHPIGDEQEVVIEYEGGPIRKFNGRYHIEVQRSTPKGFIGIQTCHSQVIPYDPAKTRKPEVTLGWFKGDTCKWVDPNETYFTVGKYRMCTTWEVIFDFGSRFTPSLCTSVYEKYI